MKITAYNIPDTARGNSVNLDNHKIHTWVVVPSASEKSDFKDFILKVLDSIGIKRPESYKIITSRVVTEMASELISKEEKSLLLVFGSTPQDLGLQIAHIGYELMTINHLTFLFADSLQKISADRKTKVDLWNALKPLSAI